MMPETLDSSLSAPTAFWTSGALGSTHWCAYSVKALASEVKNPCQCIYLCKDGIWNTENTLNI